MNKAEDLKKAAFEEIDRHQELIIELGMSIWKEPEEGFNEFKTAEKVQTAFHELDFSFTSKLAVTGVKGLINGSSTGPTVAIIGELDAIINPEHPYADKETGAVHACGHHAQIASLVAAGYGLKKIMKSLSGRVVLFAVPAEELINFEFRKFLREKAKITFYSGKQELIRLGEFDDIDIAFMHHAYPDTAKQFAFLQTMNALICKDVRFIGKSSHAGGAPEKGANAMHAYHVALSAINSQRETFRDVDAVRVHGIVTKGGDSVNVVPGEVVVEMMVRAKTMDAIKDANKKVDRALRAGGLGIGTDVEIRTSPGYQSPINNEKLRLCWTRNTEAILGEGSVQEERHSGVCTDMGDLSQILPCVHPFISGGFSGSLHGSDFRLEDGNAAFLSPAKIMAGMVVDLLFNGAEEVKQVIDDFTPGLTKQEYLDQMDSYFDYGFYPQE